MFESIVGGLGGSALSAASSAAGGFGSMLYDCWKYKDSQDYNQWMYEHRHQMEVDDLRAAGLNPILSAMGSPGSYAGSSAGAVVNPLENVTRDFTTAKRTLKELELVDKQKNLLDQQARKTSLESDILEPKGALGKAVGEVTKSVLDKVVEPANSALSKVKGLFTNPFSSNSAKSFNPMSDAERDRMIEYISNVSMREEPKKRSATFILDAGSGRYEKAPSYFGPRSRSGR